MNDTDIRYLDSHCHLPEQPLTPGISGIMEGKGGVTRMLCNATREEDWQPVIKLAARGKGGIPFLGIHPWFADSAGAGWEERLMALLERIPAGIGETGLDKSCRADFAGQQRIFQTQLRMAAELRRPLVIHCVKAWGRLLEMLEQSAAPLPPVMIHSFGGSAETLQRLLRLGCFISFSARVTTDSRLHPCLLQTPLARLLLETDAPAKPGRQLSPGSHDQKIIYDEPAAIAKLYELAATMRGMALDEFRQEIWKNGEIFTDTIVPR